MALMSSIRLEDVFFLVGKLATPQRWNFDLSRLNGFLWKSGTSLAFLVIFNFFFG